MNYLIEPQKQVEICARAEVLILGGGPSGIAAAIASARSGSKTILLERYGFLGGMGTAAMVTNFCGLHANINGMVQRIVHGVADDILARLEDLGGLNAPHHIKGRNGGHDTAAQAYDTAAYKVVADELLKDAGVDIRFHALAAGVAMKNTSSIDAVILETKSGRKAIKAEIFID
ncbi:MAG: FAD-dependent oxidoreductase, partial [Pseudomonadota bacterium]|nr:FAD-dependent oxidoreductase [Pseudomonadota bacterium]